MLTFVPRHLRTFPYNPYLYPYLAYKDSSSLSNIFVSTTHSYVYVAFSITTSFSALYPGSCLLRNMGDIYNYNKTGVRLGVGKKEKVITAISKPLRITAVKDTS